MKALFAVVMLALCVGPALAQDKAPEAPKPEAPRADEPDRFHGEYDGTAMLEADAARQARGMVIARDDKQGNRTYVVRLVTGKITNAKPGLEVELSGKAEGDKVVLADKAGAWTGVIEAGGLTAKNKEKLASSFDLRLTRRESPTLGATPPAGAVVLLAAAPGQAPSLEAWANAGWKALPDGSMEVVKGDQRTKADLGSVKLHLEFLCPFQPDKTGQGRGNSGVYLQDRYEVQVLDSFGLISRDNDCGGIYKIAEPKVNACLPPLQWQTYDITFHAAKFDADGKVTANPRITVEHNGVVIHDNVEIPKVTGGAKGNSHVPAAPLRLQDHGNRVRYRNIWYVPLKD